MNRINKLSYCVLAFVLIMVGWLGLGTPFLTVLFSTFALRKLTFFRKNSVAILLFIVLVCSIFYGTGLFLKRAFTELPVAVSLSVPKVVEYAKQQHLDLPFADLDSFNALAVNAVTKQLGDFAKFAQIATKEFVFLIIGLVIAISIFLNGKLEIDPISGKRNLYSLFCTQISNRFVSFYKSFATVMGAQIVISSINTIFTSVYIIALGFPFSVLIIVLTFLCGLLPIIGNVISNSVIVSIALTVSPKLAIGSLVFLIAIHKLEYFLNSKIIGGRIKSPMWLTLLGLIIGERLMGIPGMILAPVVLHYARVEMEQVEIRD